MTRSVFVRSNARGLPRGTTLLEVMFAIGVAGVGILGVAVLLPMAGHQAARGRVFDKVASHGKNAVQAFELAGGTRPANWTFSNGVTVLAPAVPPATSANAPGVFAFGSTGPAPFPVPAASFRSSIVGTGYVRSFCIDPLFAATNGYDSSNPNPEVFRFPADMSAISMERITLRQSAAGPLAHVNNALPGGSLGGPMERFQAEQLCMAGDDLNFQELDPRQEMPPLQQWQLVGGAAARRQFEGHATWLAVLTPKFDIVTFNAAETIDDYNLTVALFDRRQIPLVSISGKPAPERVVEVDTISGSGYRGGQMLLTSTPASNSAADMQLAELDLALEHGQWIMLSGYVIPNSAINTTGSDPGPVVAPMPTHKWYKVVAADEQATFNSTAGQWQRWVTLDGPDWPVDDGPGRPGRAPTRTQAQNAGLSLPDLNGDGTSPDEYRIEATLMNGIISVYEKTIRLETTSLWTN